MPKDTSKTSKKTSHRMRVNMSKSHIFKGSISRIYTALLQVHNEMTK